MPNTPPQLVRTASGAGWTNPTAIEGTASQAFRALAATSSTPLLTGTNCGFAVPVGATIAGVVVSATGQAENSFELGLSNIQLVGVAGAIKNPGFADWVTTPQVFSYGSPTDLWGAALTPAIVNSAGFGFQAQVQNFSSNPETASINAYTMTVYYSFGSVSNAGIPSPLNMLLIPAQIGFNFSFYTLDPTNFDDPASGGFYNWKTEDAIAGRTPTISRAIISYRNLGPASFTLILTATDDAGDVVTVSVPVSVGTAAKSGRIATKVVGIALTGQNINVGVSRIPGSGPLSITKVRLEGRVETTVY